MPHGDEVFDWVEEFVAKQVATAGRMAGYYNHNYRVEHCGHTYLVRIPIPDSDVMDLRRIDEVRVLEYIERAGFAAPRIVYVSKTRSFAVHSWIIGETLNDLYPDADPMPNWIPEQVATQMARLHKIDPAPFSSECRNLAVSPDTRRFFRAHYEFDCEVHRRLLPTTAGLYRRLGVPDAPFRGLDALAEGIRPRPFVICHSDIHRKNILLRADNEELTILDWELVLVGDPIYDIAVHFHKMRYSPEQESIFIDRYAANSDTAREGSAVRREVDLYLKLERVKSAVIDAYRARGDLQTGALSRDASVALATRYARKLDRARAVWFSGSALSPSDPEAIRKNLSAR